MIREKDMNVSSEQKTLLLFHPHMAALIFASKHKVADEKKDPGLIAATDGNTVWYGKIYESLPQSEKNFIFLHEIMHGVFRHVPRTKLIQLQRGFVYGVLANYAADAIINTGIENDNALKGITLFSMPKEFPGINMDSIHAIIAEAIKFSKKKPPSNYDEKAQLGLQMEIVYDWLLWSKNAVEEKRKGQSKAGGSGAKGSNGSPVPSDETAIERIMRTEEAWDLEEACEEIRRLLEEGKTSAQIIDEINKDINDARGKIQSIIQGMKIQGMGAGNLLIDLEGDLPPSVIPWDRKLRRITTKELSTKMSDSYTRFGSATRAAISMNRPVPFQPGMTIFSERPRVLVVLDTSGSHVNELRQCFSEIQSIARMRNAAIDVITFDDGVQDKIEIKNKQDFKKVLEKGVSGGGGTNLGNVFEEAKKMKTPYKVMIIMTDGYLTPPKDTKGIKIMWVVTPGGTTEGLNKSGEVIYLPDYQKAA